MRTTANTASSDGAHSVVLSRRIDSAFRTRPAATSLSTQAVVTRPTRAADGLMPDSRITRSTFAAKSGYMFSTRFSTTNSHSRIAGMLPRSLLDRSIARPFSSGPFFASLSNLCIRPDVCVCAAFDGPALMPASFARVIHSCSTSFLPNLRAASAIVRHAAPFKPLIGAFRPSII